MGEVIVMPKTNRQLESEVFLLKRAVMRLLNVSTIGELRASREVIDQLPDHKNAKAPILFAMDAVLTTEEGIDGGNTNCSTEAVPNGRGPAGPVHEGPQRT